jgi:hypothetical protein
MAAVPTTTPPTAEHPNPQCREMRWLMDRLLPSLIATRTGTSRSERGMAENLSAAHAALARAQMYAHHDCVRELRGPQ